MRKTLPQYKENEYHNLTDGSLGVWKFVSRVKNSISVVPIFIPNPDYIPIRLYPDLGNTIQYNKFNQKNKIRLLKFSEFLKNQH